MKKIRFQSRRKFWKWLDPLLQILGIWIFSLISGAAPCVLRAAVMFSFLIIGKAFLKNASIYNMLAASCFVLLIWNPNYVFDVGFQLSYIGLLGIVYFQPKIYAKGLEKINNSDLLSRIYHFRFFDFQIRNKILKNIIKFPVADYCWQLTCVSLGATIAVTPLSIFYFHQFPTYFWLSGLLVVPLAGWALYVGLLLFILHFCSTFLASLLGKLLWVIIWLLNQSLYLIDMIPPGAIKHIWWSGLSVFLVYFGLLFIITFMNTKKVKWITYGVFGIVLLLSMRYSYVSINNESTKEIMIYNTGYYTLIDCINGNDVYSFASKDIPDRTVNFAAYGYRLTKNALPDEVKLISIEDSLETNIVSYKNKLLVFNNKKIVFVSSRIVPMDQKINCDYLFIRDNPDISISEILNNFECNQIIFDASNKHKKVENWKKECADYKVKFYDISENYLKIEL